MIGSPEQVSEANKKQKTRTNKTYFGQQQRNGIRRANKTDSYKEYRLKIRRWEWEHT